MFYQQGRELLHKNMQTHSNHIHIFQLKKVTYSKNTSPFHYFLRDYKVTSHFIDLFHFYFTDAPFSSVGSTVASFKTPFDSPARIIPCDNSPRSFTGFKFATTITFSPIKASGS